MNQALGIEAIRGAARQTGGELSAYALPAVGLQRILNRTASSYLLGYYPKNVSGDKYRNIKVRVARPGLSLSYRHGYFATPPVVDVRAATSKQRINATLQDGRVFPDIPFELHVTAVTGRVDIRLSIDPSAVQFVDRDGRKMATLEIAAVVGQSGKDSPDFKQDALDLSLDRAAFQRIKREKISYTTSIPVTGNPRNRDVKVVVYDYAADRVGSATGKIR